MTRVIRDAREDSMPDATTRDPRPKPLSAADMSEARWMDATMKARATRPVGAGGYAPVAPLPETHGGKSYYDTRWPLVNAALALTERVTRGRAGTLQRATSYVIIGGAAALVNLGVLAIFKYEGSFKVVWYLVLANIVAYEVSILANFIPNDYFTFRFLPGHSRSWWARCLRFHITSLSGVAVSSALFFVFYSWVGLEALLAQAAALLLAVFYNFTVHHLFTYAKQHE